MPMTTLVQASSDSQNLPLGSDTSLVKSQECNDSPTRELTPQNRLKRRQSRKLIEQNVFKLGSTTSYGSFILF